LASGGYQRRVDAGFIATVPQKTLVLWGEEDDVLPVEDAAKFEASLPQCAGVVMIPDAMHAPALENPTFVAEKVADYVRTFSATA
jgi:pimeloyl-ACP methyl ester carboxylesterase